MRSRSIKPGFYKNEDLAECSIEARLLFPGLWMMADRRGRMEYRPKRIKAEVFPFDSFDVESLLGELEEHGLVLSYICDDKKYLWIPTFSKHQNPHTREVESAIPPHPFEAEHNPGSDKVMPEQDQGNAQHPLTPDSGLLITDSSPLEKVLPGDGEDAVHGQEDTQSEPVYALPLRAKAGKEKSYPVTKELFDVWEEAYPLVDVRHELKEIRAWLVSNPKKRPASDMPRFVNSWLDRAQNDKSRQEARASPSRQPVRSFQQQAQESVFDEFRHLAAMEEQHGSAAL